MLRFHSLRKKFVYAPAFSGQHLWYVTCIISCSLFRLLSVKLQDPCITKLWVMISLAWRLLFDFVLTPSLLYSGILTIIFSGSCMRSDRPNGAAANQIFSFSRSSSVLCRPSSVVYAKHLHSDIIVPTR